MIECTRLSRREVLITGAAAGTAFFMPGAFAAASTSVKVQAFPLEAVRLHPSIFLDALSANTRYLHSLQPDRLLHNFRVSAKLEPRGEVYGGWESRGIAGHSLGHYLSACALMYAQTGDEECARRVAYIVEELAACQSAHGDGYIGGTTVERDGKVLDGKVVYEEVKRGNIRSNGFDLNGGWVPFYTWHKVHAGLLDAHRYCASDAALRVAVKMSTYLAEVLEPLNDSQLQQVLAAEHGGLNEVYAEMFARTGERRWLKLAEKIYHRKVLDPLASGRDELAGLHANTQIPKLIGLARLYELTGEPRYADAAKFFWETVTRDHSYVIGGNSEREHFGAPRVLSTRLTDQTCEACNTYNMLKLTRQLYSWQPKASYFDFYERAHLNHTMSHQDPATGMFTYMTPMMSGVERRYSTPFDSFWCCVGSGMESHAKHGESIYWHSDDTVYVNLYYASKLEWKERGAELDMMTSYPHSDRITLRVVRSGQRGLQLALRIPMWCKEPSLSVNGKSVRAQQKDGYMMLKRNWRDGDVIQLALPMPLRVEPTPDNPRVVAFVSGPLVLAADLGPPLAADVPLEIAPALVTADVTKALTASNGAPHVFSTGTAGRPSQLQLRPFYAQHGRRTAMYFPLFSESDWEREKQSYAQEYKALAALEARTIDQIYLGEMQPERDHALVADRSEPVTYLGRKGRIIQGAGFFEFRMAVRPEPLVLRAVYWGEDRDRQIDILIDGKVLTTERLMEPSSKQFIERDYPIPLEMISGKSSVVVRFASRTGHWTSVYGCRLLRASQAANQSARAD